MYKKLPKRRPKAPKEFMKNWTSDDFYTRSDIKIEYTLCDCLKIVLLMAEQMMCIEKLQKEDVIALIKNDIERHFVEEDLLK